MNRDAPNPPSTIQDLFQFTVITFKFTINIENRESPLNIVEQTTSACVKSDFALRYLHKNLFDAPP